MHEKILEKVMEAEKKSCEEFLEEIGINPGSGIKNLYSKKNTDVFILLSELGLIEKNPENGEIIDKFYDYLILVGIDNGLAIGQRMILDSIRDDEKNYDEIMKIDTEDLVNLVINPRVIEEIMEDNEHDE